MGRRHTVTTAGLIGIIGVYTVLGFGSGYLLAFAQWWNR